MNQPVDPIAAKNFVKHVPSAKPTLLTLFELSYVWFLYSGGYDGTRLRPHC